MPKALCLTLTRRDKGSALLGACGVLLGLSGGLSGAAVQAQSKDAASTPPRVYVDTSPIPGEPAVRRTVLEDDNTRIDEMRVRGQTERVVVKSKHSGMPAWEIRPASPGRESATDSRLPRDNASLRQWSVLKF